MKQKVLILVLMISLLGYGQKKKIPKTVDQQVIEYLQRFDKLDKSQQRTEANKLVTFLNTTDTKTKELWLVALDKYDKTAKKNKVDVASPTEVKSNGIIVSTFSSIPSEFEGCSFLFAKSKTALQSEKFVYFDDMGSNAIIAINGETKRLKKVSSFMEAEDEIMVYSNDEFSAYIHSKKYLGDSSEESQMYSAELVVKDEKGNEVKARVYGEGGC